MSQGQRTWFVRRKYYAWESWPWPSESDEVKRLLQTEQLLGIRLPGEDEKLALLEGWPDAFVGSGTSWGGPKISVRLARVDPDHLVELVTDAWYGEAPKYLQKEYDDGRLV